MSDEPEEVRDEDIPDAMRRVWATRGFADTLSHRVADVEAGGLKVRDSVPFERLTWGGVLTYLKTCTPAELAQPVQVLHDDGDCTHPVLLMPGVVMGTVAALCHTPEGEIGRETRGPDFAHHPEQVVLLIDGAPFSAEGDTFFTLERGPDGNVGMRGNVTGKLKHPGED